MKCIVDDLSCQTRSNFGYVSLVRVSSLANPAKAPPPAAPPAAPDASVSIGFYKLISSKNTAYFNTIPLF